MKALPLKNNLPCEPCEATHLALNKPGPVGHFVIPVLLTGTRNGSGCFTWNGDTEKPTLKPSVLTKGRFRCHTWIKDGRVQFLFDSTHDLAGRTLDLLDVDLAFWRP